MSADVCHDTVSDHLSGDRSTARTSDEVSPTATCFMDQRNDIVFVFRVRHTVRNLTVHTGIGGVRYLVQTVRLNLYHISRYKISAQPSAR